MTALRIAAAAALSVATIASAQVVAVVPAVYASAEAPGSNSAPIAFINNPRTVQFLMNANQLTDLVDRPITGITYRLSNVTPGAYPLVPTTWAEYRIRLGPAVAPAAATTTFADNYTSPPQLVRSGPLTVPPIAWPTGGGGTVPAPWGFEIVFDTPYVYTGGHLALLLTHPGSDNTSQGNSLLDAAAASSPGLGTDFACVIGPGLDAATGTPNNFPNVVRFTAGAVVPEPSALALGGLALAAVGRRLWHNRRHERA